MTGYEVVVGAGTLRSPEPGAIRFPHRWTDEGVSVEAEFTGAHLLHLAAAGCVLNDVYREASGNGTTVRGVRVRATGDFDTERWVSTGIEYTVELDTDADAADVADLLACVEAVAEIPRVIRAGAPVRRATH